MKPRLSTSVGFVRCGDEGLLPMISSHMCIQYHLMRELSRTSFKTARNPLNRFAGILHGQMVKEFRIH